MMNTKPMQTYIKLRETNSHKDAMRIMKDESEIEEDLLIYTF